MLTAVVLALLGVVSPPLRLSKPVGKPPVVQTPPPVQTAPPDMRNDQPAAARTALSGLSGRDLVEAPNVFRGMSASGQPTEVQPPLLEREEELELVTGSGTKPLDIAAENALALSNRLPPPPLPAEYCEERVGVTWSFFYNMTERDLRFWYREQEIARRRRLNGTAP